MKILNLHNFIYIQFLIKKNNNILNKLKTENPKIIKKKIKKI